MNETDVRDFLHRMADEAGSDPVDPRPVVRKARRRAAFTVAGTLLTIGALVAGGIVGANRLTTDEAAPEKPADQPDAEETKVTVMVDRKIADMTPDVRAPEVPYLIDLNTRDMTPLPESITRSLATGRFWNTRFAASPDGSSLAFVGEGEDGSPQIFTAGLDGTDLRQVTNDPKRATAPAWSPDGTKIVYDGYGSGDNLNLFVLDLATGESRQITHEAGGPRCFYCSLEPQFMPDGSSIIYTSRTGDPTGNLWGVRTVPVSGGESTLLLGAGEGLGEGLEALDYWQAGSMSPDGSLVTAVGSGYLYETLPDGAPKNCDRCRFLIDVDGTDIRIISGWTATTSGAWSPDGTRIVLAHDPEPPFSIMIVDVVTGEASMVAGRLATAAIWLDDDTLLVDVQGPISHRQ
jgi:WD40 repeat protein